jgi:hypothetical protein
MTLNCFDRLTNCPASTASRTVSTATEASRSSSATSMRVTWPFCAKIQARTAFSLVSSHWETIPADRSTCTSFGLRGAPVPSFPTPVLPCVMKLSDGIAAKAGLTLEPIATNQRNHVGDSALGSVKASQSMVWVNPPEPVISSSLASER